MEDIFILIDRYSTEIDISINTAIHMYGVLFGTSIQSQTTFCSTRPKRTGIHSAGHCVW
jgi:hypothetical protein